MTTSTAAGVQDMRGIYRQALCRRLAGSTYSCDDVLRRLPGESVPDSAFARVGTHNEKGRITLQDLLETYVEHLEHHLKFLRHKRQLLGKPV